MCPLWFTLFFLAGCEPREAAPASATRDTAHPYVETVPGSTVTFTMRPIESWDANGRTRVVWMAETETTWDAYDVFALRLDENPDNVAAAGIEGPDAVTRPTQPYAPVDRGWGHGGYPVMSVTFHAAQKYCEWLSQKTGRRYRLPTADEFKDLLWETCGDAAGPGVIESAWLAENSGNTTHPVARKLPNRKGCYDVTGNVAEWCAGADGKPVVCGGSFRDTFDELGRLANKLLVMARRQTPDWTRGSPTYPPSKWWLSNAPHVGFRIVCEEPPK